jgi:hypothetical protein
MAVQCDVCRQRDATGGNVRRVDGRDVTTNYCDDCRAKVPVGHRAWATTQVRASIRRRDSLLRYLSAALLIILAMAMLWWQSW